MESFVLKRSISRKCFYRLSKKQQHCITNEIKRSLQCKNSTRITLKAPNTISDTYGNKSHHYQDSCSNTNNQETLDFVHAENNSFIDLGNNECNIADNADSDNGSSNCNNNCSDDSSLVSTSSSVFQSSFRERLASCFVENNITHAQGNRILSVLRTHDCFYNLPKDMRTLISTPRDKVVTFKVEPGEYLHFDFEASIVQVLKRLPIVSLPSHLEIDFSTDGCSLDRSGSIQIWPIQYKLANIKHMQPIIVGIYKGNAKLEDPNTFFEKFIADVNKILDKGGVIFNENKIPIHLRCFIADAPARAFILNHRGHMSSNPCSKCKISATKCNGHNIFYGINSILRTNDEYARCLDEDHHKDGNSPLSKLPIGLVSQVPFEYMHLVCLGVVKKLLSAWVDGKYSRLSKLSATSINLISTRLEKLVENCPSDFAKRPKSLNAYTKYKATELRQFLLYTGPVVTYGILNQQVYTHFLFLHAAIRILVSTSLSTAYLNFADLALKKFVERCELFYSQTFYSYNVHGLIHLTNDVRQLGPLDSFSAFPFENNMKFLKKYCRKPDLLLQQISNRFTEIEMHVVSDSSTDSSTFVSQEHNFGPLPLNVAQNSSQYHKIQYNEISLSLNTRDNCCLLNDGSICIIINIFKNVNSYYLVVKKFLNVNDFYNIGISSSALYVFKCSTLSNNIYSVSISEVHKNCYKMPFWSRNDDDSTDDEDITNDSNCIQSGQFVVAAILHSEKT